MSSQVEQKRAYNKLKHDLESWRDVIVQIDSLLTWEQNYYPAIIFGFVSLLYIILWQLNLSVITLAALCGLIIVALDYGYPLLSRFLYSAEQWNGDKEASFERVCTQLCAIKLSLTAWYEYIFNTQERKSSLFVIIVSAVLLLLAWIGAVVDNLLLAYFLTLILAFYPGIRDKRIFNVLKERGSSVINSKMQQLRDNTKKAE